MRLVVRENLDAQHFGHGAQLLLLQIVKGEVVVELPGEGRVFNSLPDILCGCAPSTTDRTSDSKPFLKPRSRMLLCSLLLTPRPSKQKSPTSQTSAPPWRSATRGSPTSPETPQIPPAGLLPSDPPPGG